MLFPTLGPSSLPVVVAQPGERHAKEQLLCWSGMTDTEHSTTSSSNKEGLLAPNYASTNKNFISLI